jgi:hypothetical protein
LDAVRAYQCCGLHNLNIKNNIQVVYCECCLNDFPNKRGSHLAEINLLQYNEKKHEAIQEGQNIVILNLMCG